MEKNNFEKQVQGKLAELNIQPSEKAWAGIESRIGKKDRTKKVLWFLLLGVFLLAGGGYLFLMEGKSDDKEIAQLPKQPIETIIQKNEIDQEISSDAVSQSDPILLNEEEQVHIKSTGKPGKSIDVPPFSLKPTTDARHKSSIKETAVKPPVEKVKVNTQVETGIADIKQDESAKETNALTGHNETGKTKNDFNTESKTESTDVLSRKGRDTSSGNKGSVAEFLILKQEINLEEKEELAIKEKNDLNKILEVGEIKNTFSSSIKSWEIGLSVSAARVFIGDGVQLGFDRDQSNIAFDIENIYDNSPGRPGTNVGQTPTGPASSPGNSYGFNAGIILKKEISQKTSFVTGLGYTYYTNSILIGNQLPAGNFSSAGMLSPYRNNFHFVNIPLSAQFHFNTTRKIPLDLAIGINVSRLVASDAVQYKSGIYEVDNSIFTKTQVGFQTGFSATFFRNLSVGPFYRYGLNPLAKEGLYGKKHLNFLGLKADLIFQKNK